jgi:hypothetical protein
MEILLLSCLRRCWLATISQLTQLQLVASIAIIVYSFVCWLSLACSNYWRQIRVRVTVRLGCAIAQVVSRRIPNSAARIRAQVSSCGICGGESDIVVSFLRVLWFPLPVLIPATAPHSSSIIRRWYDRPVSDRRAKWTHKGMVRSDMSKPALIFLSLQEYTQQNTLSKF